MNILSKGKTVKIKASKLKKKTQTVSAKNAFSVTGAQGAVTYKRVSGNKKITVSSGGKVTVKKGLKKGTYTIRVRVTAAGNRNFKAKTVYANVKIQVK